MDRWVWVGGKDFSVVNLTWSTPFLVFSSLYSQFAVLNCSTDSVHQYSILGVICSLRFWTCKERNDIYRAVMIKWEYICKGHSIVTDIECHILSYDLTLNCPFRACDLSICSLASGTFWRLWSCLEIEHDEWSRSLEASLWRLHLLLVLLPLFSAPRSGGFASHSLP